MSFPILGYELELSQVSRTFFSKNNSLSTYRKLANVPLTDVAFLLNMDIGNLSRIEKGMREPNSRIIILFIYSSKPLYLHFTFKRHQLDSAQTSTSEYSNGGFMSYEIIVKKFEVFRTEAGISGTMSLKTWSNRTFAKAVSVLQLSRGLDRVVPPNGLTNLYGGRGGAPKISDIMLFWAELNTHDVHEYIE